MNQSHWVDELDTALDGLGPHQPEPGIRQLAHDVEREYEAKGFTHERAASISRARSASEPGSAPSGRTRPASAPLLVQAGVAIGGIWLAATTAKRSNGAWRDPTYSPGGCSSSSSGGSAPFVPLPSPLPALPNPSALLANLPGWSAAALPLGILAVLFAVAYDEVS